MWSTTEKHQCKIKIQFGFSPQRWACPVSVQEGLGRTAASPGLQRATLLSRGHLLWFVLDRSRQSDGPRTVFILMTTPPLILPHRDIPRRQVKQ